MTNTQTAKRPAFDYVSAACDADTATVDYFTSGRSALFNVHDLRAFIMIEPTGELSW